MQNEIKKAIDIDLKSRRNSIFNSFVPLKEDNNEIEKAHVKSYTRATKSGKMVNVKEYEDKRQKKNVDNKKVEEAFSKYFLNNPGKLGFGISEVKIYKDEWNNIFAVKNGNLFSYKDGDIKIHPGSFANGTKGKVLTSLYFKVKGNEIEKLKDNPWEDKTGKLKEDKKKILKKKK